MGGQNCRAFGLFAIPIAAIGLWASVLNSRSQNQPPHPRPTWSIGLRIADIRVVRAIPHWRRSPAAMSKIFRWPGLTAPVKTPGGGLSESGRLPGHRGRAGVHRCREGRLSTLLRRGHRA
jgi:hypothetical protein